MATESEAIAARKWECNRNVTVWTSVKLGLDDRKTLSPVSEAPSCRKRSDLFGMSKKKTHRNDMGETLPDPKLSLTYSLEDVRGGAIS